MHLFPTNFSIKYFRNLLQTILELMMKSRVVGTCPSQRAAHDKNYFHIHVIYKEKP